METSSILHDEWKEETADGKTHLYYHKWLEEKLKRRKDSTQFNKETILEMINGVKETVIDMRGGPFVSINIVAAGNVKTVMSPFESMDAATRDINEQLKKDADEETTEEFTFLKENQKRIIKKGEISTAWRRGSLCVIICGMEKLLINETLTNFCKRMDWEL